MSIINAAISQVRSVFGRKGDVVAEAGDYNAGQITFTPCSPLTSITVQNAICEAASLISGGGTDHHAGWYDIQGGETVTVSTRKQMRINGAMTLSGTLILDGNFVLD